MTIAWGVAYLLWSRDVVNYWPVSLGGSAALIVIALIMTLILRRREFSTQEPMPPLPIYRMQPSTAFILTTILSVPFALIGAILAERSPSASLVALGFIFMVPTGMAIGAHVTYPWTNSLHQVFDDPPPSQPLEASPA